MGDQRILRFDVATESVQNGTNTIFILLPCNNSNIVSLKGIQTFVTVKDVREKLELHAGLPSQTYEIRLKENETLKDNDILEFGNNIHSGAIVKVQLLPEWKHLYDTVQTGHKGSVIKCLNKSIHPSEKDQDNSDEKKTHYFVALYFSTYIGLFDLCRELISKGKWKCIWLRKCIGKLNHLHSHI